MSFIIVVYRYTLPTYELQFYGNLLPLSSACLLLRQGSKSQVWLDNLHLGPDVLGILSLDGWVNNDIVTGNPVDGRGDFVLVAGLE